MSSYLSAQEKQIQTQSIKIQDQHLVLPCGWLFDQVYAYEAMLWGRWPKWNSHVQETKRASFINAALPEFKIDPITWERSDVAYNMLFDSISAIANDSNWTEHPNWIDYIEFLCHWILYGLRPEEIANMFSQVKEGWDIQPGASKRLSKVFDVRLLLLYPSNYFAEILEDLGYPVEQKRYYPLSNSNTPVTVDDLAGNGMLAYSNSSTSIGVACKSSLSQMICLINAALYVPWVFCPLQGFGGYSRKTGVFLIKE